jgi:hypothetical protein
MSGISAARIVLRSGARRPEPSGAEASRIAFLIARDGEDAALDWVRRTLAIYRSAVLDPRHFASFPQYRDLFLHSCASFRSWLYPHS